MKFVLWYSFVLEFSDSGVFWRSLYDFDGLVVIYISEVYEYDGYLYLGFFRFFFFCRFSF